MKKRVQLGLLLTMTISSYVFSDIEVQTVTVPKQYDQSTPPTRLGQDLQKLLEVHGLLLNQAIVAAWRNAPTHVIESGNQQLLTNARQISDVFASLYGQQVGEEFEALFRQHILLGGQYIQAVKANNRALANEVSQQAIANGRMIARFLNHLFPATPYQTWQNMLDEHVTMEAQQTDAYFQRDLDRANSLKQHSIAQLRELANLIATNAERQRSS